MNKVANRKRQMQGDLSMGASVSDTRTLPSIILYGNMQSEHDSTCPMLLNQSQPCADGVNAHYPRQQRRNRPLCYEALIASCYHLEHILLKPLLLPAVPKPSRSELPLAEPPEADSLPSVFLRIPATRPFQKRARKDAARATRYLPHSRWR